MSRRERLLDDAWKIQARDGRVAPEVLARESDASKALVFHHFRSLEGLRDAMAERVLAETQRGLDALADEERDPRLRLAALARALLAQPPEGPREAGHVLTFWLQDDANGRTRGALRDALLVDFVTKSLKETRARADPQAVAGLILSRWHGATVLYATRGPIDFERETERTLAELEALVG